MERDGHRHKEVPRSYTARQQALFVATVQPAGKALPTRRSTPGFYSSAQRVQIDGAWCVVIKQKEETAGGSGAMTASSTTTRNANNDLEPVAAQAEHKEKKGRGMALVCNEKDKKTASRKCLISLSISSLPRPDDRHRRDPDRAASNDRVPTFRRPTSEWVWSLSFALTLNNLLCQRQCS